MIRTYDNQTFEVVWNGGELLPDRFQREPAIPLSPFYEFDAEKGKYHCTDQGKHFREKRKARLLKQLEGVPVV